MTLDAIVVGAGPNGLAGAIALAQAGHSVRVYERDATIGGSTRSAELTLPGYTHDVCAAVHALALASPFLRTLPLAQYGLDLIQPPVPFAHPFDDGTAIIVRRSVAETAASLGSGDAKRYRKHVEPLVQRADDLMEALLGPIGLRHPMLMARFSIDAGLSAEVYAKWNFADERTRAMFGGVAAHSIVPLDKIGTAGYGLGLLVSAHAYGWPIARGGSQHLPNAMASYLRSLGGEIVTGESIESLDALPHARAVLCDVTPRSLLRMAGDKMPARYGRRLAKYRYGPGVFKIDWALNSPVPWRDPACTEAGTLHLGGSMRELAISERDAWDGRVTDNPFVLVVQPTCFDASRAPAGKHTLWAYCHVPHGSTTDMTERIERQIERFAPGFHDCIEARNVLFPADLERRNPNLVGGDIAGGAGDFPQMLIRPLLSLDPYATVMKGVYLCSSSTSPGIGVHGMCGYYAARSALKHSLR
ncbi:MAG: NAD(P)/FAD-dependent oxidoreductase [Gemmatimonadaceae bacterium]